MVVAGPGEQGEAEARRLFAASKAERTGTGGPKPGEGPSKQERESGLYDLLFVGLAPDGRQVRVAVKGDRDPGYGSTSKMIAECAVCLLRDGRMCRPASGPPVLRWEIASSSGWSTMPG